MRSDVSKVPRWWWKVDADAHAPIDDDGFLREEHGASGLDDLADAPCLVLLGDSGLGKSTAVDAAREALGARCRVRELGSANDGGDVRSVIREGLARATSEGVHHLFLDGLDEALTKVDAIGKKIADELLGDLDALQRLRLRIVCRAAALPERLPEQLERAYGKEQVARYSLLPLRWSDVETLVRHARADDAEEILPLLREPPLAALAARPITLKLLLESRTRAMKTARSSYEVYDEAMKSLLVDPDEDRRGAGHGSVHERRALARSLAVATLLGGRPRIVASQVPTGSLADAVTADDVSPIASPKELQRLVTSAPLFDKERFAHRSYAEFLSAELLAQHASVEVAVGALFLSAVVTTRVVPQLRGVAALLGARRRFFERLLVRDPMTLLDVDPLFVDDAQRARLIDAVLSRGEELRTLGVWHRGGERLARFTHPGFTAQLSAWLMKREAHELAHEAAVVALMRARDATLAPLLADIAVDRQRSHDVRYLALTAVSESGDDDAIRALRPLIDGGAEDADDDLKALALEALWPKFIDGATMFGALSPRKDPHLFGSYFGFVASTVPEHLSRADVLSALRWCTAHAHRDGIWPPDKLVKRTLALAVEHLTDAGVSDALVECLRAMVEVHAQPIEKIAEVLKSPEEGARESKSWALLELLVPRCESLAPKRFFWWSLRPLAAMTDPLALLDHAQHALSPEEELVWVELALDRYREATKWDPAVTERLLEYKSKPKENLARERVKWLWRFWDFDDPEVRGERERARQLARQESKRSARAEQAKTARFERARQIEELITRAGGGALDAFWEVIEAMSTRVRDDGLVEHWSQTQVDRSEAWEGLSAEPRRVLLFAATAYLRERGPEAEVWFGKGLMHWPALAGRQAFVLLQRQDPAALAALSDDVWARWTPTLLSPSWMSEEAPREVTRALLVRAYAADGVAYRKRAIELLRTEAHAYPFALDVVEPVLDGEFVGDLRRFVETHEVSADTLRGVLSCISRRDEGTSVALALDVVNREWETSPKRAVRAAAHLVGRAPDRAWPTLEALFERSPERGAEAVQLAESRTPAGIQWVPPFASERLTARFYSWGVRAMRRLDEPNRRSGLVTPRVALGWCLPRVRERLVTAGTAEAIEALEALRIELPDEAEALGRVLSHAREYYLEQSWRPRAVSELIATFCAVQRAEGA